MTTSAEPGKSLALKKVTLFTSPLAYFQRTGSSSQGLSLDVPLKQKDLCVDTLSVNVPASIGYSGVELGREEESDPMFDFGLGSKGEILSSLGEFRSRLMNLMKQTGKREPHWASHFSDVRSLTKILNLPGAQCQCRLVMD